MKQQMGFIGVGHMGGAMAMRLLNAGYPLSIADPDPKVAAPLVAKGAKHLPNARAVADVAEIVFACVPAQKISVAVALGPDGIKGGKAIKHYVEMSTIGVTTVREIAVGLADTKIGFLDCPVSGGPKGAEEGTLSTMCSGKNATFEAVRPALSAIAAKIFHLDEQPGSAQVAKLVNNIVGGVAMGVTCEALVMGVKAGLDATMLNDVLNASTGRTTASTDKVPRAILPRTFDYGGPLRIGMKDNHLYIEECKKLGVPTWFGPALQDLYDSAGTQGYGDRDFTEIIRYIEDLVGGVEVKGRG